MKITNNLLNNIPVEKRELVLNKMEKFETILLESRSLADVPKGFWIRKVEGTDIYKFRINRGDRILFKYAQINGENTILFIDFCNHDEQIRRARNNRTGGSIIDFKINKQAYEEDEFDKEINEYVKNEVYSKLVEVKNDLVIEDEYISLSIEEDDIRNMHFLSLKQYECLSNVDRPSVIFGCAGSGKTMVAIRKLIINNDFMINTAYITCSPSILEKTKMMYSKFSNNDKYISFYTFSDLCKKIIGLEEETIVIGYRDFYKWMSKNEILRGEDLKLDIREVWIEINTIIKGSISRGNYKNILSKEEYFNCKNSHFDIKTKKNIHRIANMYNHWLMTNKYYDDNDLASLALENLNSKHKFDGIVYDEIQELTNCQLLLILSIDNNINNIMLLGDINQSINIDKFNLDFLKDLVYEKNSVVNEKFMIKNYRNGSETVNWINEFKRIKNNKFKSMGIRFRQDEESVREGIKPQVYYNFQNEKEFFSKVDEDVSSIIVVADESDKEQLKRKGYGLGRVFSIEDVRGLEYNNIYCYNILSKFDDVWGNILSNDSKFDDIYSVYFNMVYIAATRAKDKLCFIEREFTKLDDRLGDYWDIINNEKILLGEVEKVIGTEEWLKEAIRLEKVGRYYQAADAYKKAGRLSDADICLKAYERKINYDNTENFTSFVLIQSEELNEQLLGKALLKIKTKYDIYISGYLEIGVEFVDFSGTRTIQKYIDNDLSIKETAEVISEELEKEYISKRSVILKVCFYKEGFPVDTRTMLEECFIDLFITFDKDSVRIIKTFYDNLRFKDNLHEAFKNESMKKVGSSYDNQALILRNKAKYESKDADDILDFIFKGKS